MDYYQESLKLHEAHRGKIEVRSKVPVENRDDLSTAYTPGVAQPCLEIEKDPALAYRYTIKGNTIAVVSDGSAVLGLGNIGGLASLPVMEGKAVLFKAFGGVDAFPVCLDTQDVDEIVETEEMVRSMSGDAVIFAMSNPEPEIQPDLAKAAGAKVVGTGRSDHPNQINNVLAFPGIFRGALDARAKDITEAMKVAAAFALAGLVPDAELTADYVLPPAFFPCIADAVGAAVAAAWTDAAR
ncbi:MAG: hypothetical protein LBR00_02390 [Clostridiales Family XIII bacterium]|jgi:malic enzyme|nr:hypothetical protein [Clostridiales Family XIII bacterium]